MHEEAQNALNAEEGQEAQRMPLNAEEEKVSQNALNSVERRGRGTGRLKCQRGTGCLKCRGRARGTEDALKMQRKRKCHRVP